MIPTSAPDVPSVDLTDLQRAVDDICAKVDQLLVERRSLVGALRAILPFVDDAADVQQLFPDSAASATCRAAVVRVRAALAEVEGR